MMESHVYDAMEAATVDSDGILRAAFDTPADFQEIIGVSELEHLEQVRMWDHLDSRGWSPLELEHMCSR